MPCTGTHTIVCGDFEIASLVRIHDFEIEQGRFELAVTSTDVVKGKVRVFSPITWSHDTNHRIVDALMAAQRHPVYYRVAKSRILFPMLKAVCDEKTVFC